MDELPELKSAFTREQMLDDLTIAGADDNGAYEALRRYRLVYPRARRRWLKSDGVRAALTIGVAGLAPFIVFGHAVQNPLKLPLVIALVLGPIVLINSDTLLYAQRKNLVYFGANRMITEERRRQIAMDFWLAGATGRSVAEAMYLELAEQNRYADLILPLTLCTVPAVFSILVGLPMVMGLYWPAIALGFALGTRCAWPQIVRNFRITLVEVQIEFWSRPRNYLKDLNQAGDFLLKGLPVGIAGALVIVPPSICAIIAEATRSGNPFPSGLFLALSALWLTAYGVFLRAITATLRRRNFMRWELMLVDADRHFQRYVLGEMMGDPDA